jgi:hypothetical protein
MTGFGSLFRVRKFVPSGSSPTYPYAGEIVTARNFYNSVKYNSKNTALINTGKSVNVGSDNLSPGTRGYALYQLAAGLKKAGYIQP